MEPMGALDTFNKHFEQAVTFVKENLPLFGFFVSLIVIQDILSLILQEYFISYGNTSRLTEIGFQVLLVWTTVYFFHRINCILTQREVSQWGIFGESFLLLPGYILQSIFWILSALVGLCLLVVPGIYWGFVFYLAPGIAVIYPDYSGTTFTLSREMAKENIWATILIILVTSIVPFVPEALLFYFTGTLKGSFSFYYSPIGAVLYLFFELILFFFIYEKVQAHRKISSSGAPSISS